LQLKHQAFETEIRLILIMLGPYSNSAVLSRLQLRLDSINSRFLSIPAVGLFSIHRVSLLSSSWCLLKQKYGDRCCSTQTWTSNGPPATCCPQKLFLRPARFFSIV